MSLTQSEVLQCGQIQAGIGVFRVKCGMCCFNVCLIGVGRLKKGLSVFRRPFVYRILGDAVALAVGSDRLEEAAEFRIVLQEREQVVQIGNGDDG